MRHEAGSGLRVSDALQHRWRGHVIVPDRIGLLNRSGGLERSSRRPVRRPSRRRSCCDFDEEIRLANDRAHRLQVGIRLAVSGP